jgi:hypothetical protein
VIYPWDRAIKGAKALVERFAMPALETPAPFGIEGTRGFVMAIADALGKRAEAARAFEEHAARIEPSFRELSAIARRYRLGFVIGDERFREALDPRKRLGVPVLEVVEEMGFEVDFLLYTARAERDVAREDGRRRFAGYRSAEELEARLRRAEAVAFYSELYFDRRLTRTGKSSFSIDDFELGLEGALATLRRLVAACRLPYFRTYSKYLGRPFAQGDA